jgi:uncharacterized protein
MADSSAELKGQLSLSRLHRFCESLLSNEGEVELDLSFGRNDKGFKTIQGHAYTTVKLQCQRCLEPVSESIDVKIDLVVVRNEDQIKDVGDFEKEPLIVEDDNVDIAALVEDDLMLALPMVAYHELVECVANGYKVVEETVDASNEGKDSGDQRSNPFAVLAELKKGTPKN